MNELDQFIKRELKIKHYGRYVDDFYLLHSSKDELKRLQPLIKEFLSDRLKLKLHPSKIYLQHINRGIPSIGVFIKPYSIHIQNRTVSNFKAVLHSRDCFKSNSVLMSRKVNSYLGLMGHYKTFNLRKSILKGNKWIFNYGWINAAYLRFKPAFDLSALIYIP